MNLIFQCSTDDAAMAWLLRLAGENNDLVTAVADNLRDRLESALYHFDGSDHDVTVRIFLPQPERQPDDLITLAEAAALADNPTISSIAGAMARGTLTTHTNPDAPQRQGRRLVSRAEFLAWRRERGWDG